MYYCSDLTLYAVLKINYFTKHYLGLINFFKAAKYSVDTWIK